MPDILKGKTLKRVDVSTSIDRVPPEYPIAWKWFEENGGGHIARLPFGKGKPEDMPMPLARQAAIYCPSYPSLPSKGAGKRRYALSVYSVGQSVYADGNRKYSLDGTWYLEYHEQRGNDPNQNYNELLLNCLEDGIPIGVMIKSRGGGYDVLGLAVIEEYDPRTHLFLLHGPMSLKQQSLVESPEIWSSTTQAVRPERRTTTKRAAQTKKPSKTTRADQTKSRTSRSKAPLKKDWYDLRGSIFARFTKSVFDAYEGACAITDSDIPELLDAVLINNEEGKRAHTVNNGILLRVDVGRLYDAGLIAISPDDYTVVTSSRLYGSGYARLNGCEIRLPEDAANVPDINALAIHFHVFRENESS